MAEFEAGETDNPAAPYLGQTQIQSLIEGIDYNIEGGVALVFTACITSSGANAAAAAAATALTTTLMCPPERPSNTQPIGAEKIRPDNLWPIDAICLSQFLHGAQRIGEHPTASFNVRVLCSLVSQIGDIQGQGVQHLGSGISQRAGFHKAVVQIVELTFHCRWV